MTIQHRVPASPEQEEAIADYVLNGGTMGLLATERTWMVVQARKKYPKCRVISADLDIENVTWVLTLEDD